MCTCRVMAVSVSAFMCTFYVSGSIFTSVLCVFQSHLSLICQDQGLFVFYHNEDISGVGL